MDRQNQLTFRVKIEQPLPTGDSVYLSVLDEVTGLPFNVHKYVMNAEDAQTYSVTLPFMFGSVVKYRYSHEEGNVVHESIFPGRPVRYRLYYVEGSSIIEDNVSGWMGSEYLGGLGKIVGYVYHSTTRLPIPNILITAGGQQAFSLADGSFLLDGLSPGMHNLVFYSIDGAYSTYQQNAVVAGGSTTPASVHLNPELLVTAIFIVNVPEDTPTDSPIRFAGNLYQLGNSFADLPGGVSSLASRMPLVGKLPDGRYMVTLNLPVGAYVEYKYTLGDGLWSSEVSSDGSYQLRQLLIPDENIIINDTVESWKNKNARSIRFHVKVPSNTPNFEGVSIQFNPGFGWMEPLPMYPTINSLGEKIWSFDLTGPFNGQSLQYRYCRQEQCGIADDVSAITFNPEGHILDPNSTPGIVNDEVLMWAYLNDPNATTTISDIQVTPRGTDFIAGVAFQPVYYPSWGSKIEQSVANVKNLNINWLILSPTWTFSNTDLPILEPIASQDVPWFDLTNSIRIAQRQGLSIGIYPTPNFPVESGLWWQNSRRDYSWWVTFFERYSSFILNTATIATDADAASLILGGEWITPALPGGILGDGTSSNVPQDAEARWRELIHHIRERYDGKISWALSYPDGLINPPPFLDAVDQIYILWSAPISQRQNASVEEMQTQAGFILSHEILPIQQLTGKPIIIAISYPSITRGAMGCIQLLGGGCLDYDLLKPPNPDIAALEINLQEQANAYHAILSAINDCDWISGFVSMGYYPPAVIQDKSISINGKPASGVVWFWSKKFLGK